MINFTIPGWVKEHCIEYENINDLPETLIISLRNKLKKFETDSPLASIVIPAYNEEKDIVKTLSSLSNLRTDFPIELIVANNNSKDRTQEILDLLEVKSVFVERQGVAFARQIGMELAKGKYILSADSDSIYPPSWATAFVNALQDKEVSCAYGQYSFIPSGNSRATLAMYELAARAVFVAKSKNRKCVNVMGFNSAYRKEDAVKLGGYKLDLRRDVDGKCEDGMMALTLSQIGKIKLVKGIEATAWTSDRRLMSDGGLGNAFATRVKREVKKIGNYFKPASV